MTIRSAAFYFLRITFLIFSILFLRDAFFKWDGYSFYMTFGDFLSDLSLVFIIYTIISILYALFLWLVLFLIYSLTRKFLKADHYEYLVFWLIFIPVIYEIKTAYFSKLSISEWSGLGHMFMLIFGGVLIVFITWFSGNYLKRILNEINDRITPLVWCFALLFVIAVPVSFFSNGVANSAYNSAYDGNDLSTGKKRPNIILVTWDTLTALDMSLYGYERATTPFISEWAKDAIVFNRAYSSSNWTTPGVMSLMTGQRVLTHHIWYRAFFNPVDDYKDNIARVLKDYGYSVYAFVQNYYAHPRTLGMNKYFEVKAEERTFHYYGGGSYAKIGRLFGKRNIAREWVIAGFLEKHFDFLFASKKAITEFLSEDVYEPFLELASQTQFKDQEKPFFVWLHTMPPHYPYYPPKPFLGAFADKNAPKSDEFLLHRPVPKGVYAPEQQAGVDHMRRRYDEFILYSDKQFEKFISSLAETIDMSNTIIVFSSDHGESFSHGWLAHEGPNLYEPLVHIPFIVKLPGSEKGKIIDMPVGVVNIAPTILALADIPVPGWMDGRSLLPLIQDRTLEPLPVFASYLIKNRLFGRPITKGTIAVWEGDYKLIYYLKDKKSLMFNLKSDPYENHNIYNEEPEKAIRLMSLINDELAVANNKIISSDNK